ncbi:MAG: hypothetical protein A2Y77_12620 [Planctomycetes bacterium RBG_13_62_9]|nr:MAG: hypothetical protein A2Y77_12620 [Planctomycetes bacterium RBG_13_62_9]
MTSNQENLSETAEEQGPEGNDAQRLVSITESIRYRKRAQSAEKKAETLAEELAQANQRIAQMSQDLDDLDVEQQLTRKLVAAGATDLEAAMLMAKARIDGKGEAQIDGCIEQLRREKGYLFGRSTETPTSRKTAGAKERATHSRTVLEQAAQKAARTGSRADLQHYLMLRKNLM